MKLPKRSRVRGGGLEAGGTDTQGAVLMRRVMVGATAGIAVANLARIFRREYPKAMATQSNYELLDNL